MKNYLFILLMLTGTTLRSQPFTNHPVNSKNKPKLVVGIVIDQMRYDYITRYWDRFSEGGFKKLVSNGFTCTNTHYNYIPTYTGPGHASIYTGTTPAIHGIIGNDWFDRKSGKRVYVTSDPDVKGTGTTFTSGNMSPSRMLSTTFTDELKVASNSRSRIIGVALKDRGSILCAGHAADAAYWFDITSGNFISSNWYVDTLPSWVQNYNELKKAEEYKSQPWELLYPSNTYSASTADEMPYEELFPGEEKPVFPHKFDGKEITNYKFIMDSPHGMTMTKDFALAAMHAEQLGKDSFTDVLAVSFSSPDYIGHMYGTHAMETEDTYLRLDKDLESFISEVENTCGKENVLFFLTADHAAIQNVMFLKEHKIPAGVFNLKQFRDSLDHFITGKYGSGKWILSFYNSQIHLDHQLISDKKFELTQMINDIKAFMENYDGIHYVFTSTMMNNQEFNYGIASMTQKGYHRARSGDVGFVLEPGWVQFTHTGTDHGAPFTYDTHVPLIFYGWQVQKGLTARPVNITDIAPTISQILGIQPPSGCTGNVIEELFLNAERK